MEGKHNNNKPLIKIALTLAVLDLVLLAFVFSGVLKLQRDIAEIQGEQKIVTEKKTEKIVKTDSEEIDTSDWKTYRNEVYSIRFPSNIKLVKNPLAEEAENSLLPKKSTDFNYPRMSIHYYSLTGTSFKIQQNSYLNRNYKNKQVTNQIIDGKEAWVLTGISNSKVVEGMVVEGRINMKNIIFTTSKNILIISTVYEDVDKDIAEIFEQIISTFKFID